ncbi:unnamed protein product [Cyprideis torosa]|uniref:Uncharacterized protein n=1 Tax=Cyprideis torosa TaxID=163714 RepID=A0A7R8W7G3_9CRUS|nr:unnamed protein product [Cyprideis torosa]CAG0882710.1 unnamed protein product [Cyprideis torosa]
MNHGRTLGSPLNDIRLTPDSQDNRLSPLDSLDSELPELNQLYGEEGLNSRLLDSQSMGKETIPVDQSQHHSQSEPKSGSHSNPDSPSGFRPWEESKRQASGTDFIPTSEDFGSAHSSFNLPSFQSQFQPFSPPPPSSTLAQAPPHPQTIAQQRVSATSQSAPHSVSSHHSSPSPYAQQPMSAPAHTPSPAASPHPQYPSLLSAGPLQTMDMTHHQIHSPYLHPHHGPPDDRQQILLFPAPPFDEKKLLDLQSSDINRELLPPLPVHDMGDGRHHGPPFIRKLPPARPSPVRRSNPKPQQPPQHTTTTILCSPLQQQQQHHGVPQEEIPQVPAVSSTHGHRTSSQSDEDKVPKKKRKRCGECPGCQRKDNCGDCAPCRNAKSHQICKARRCEKLTERKPKKPKSFMVMLMASLVRHGTLVFEACIMSCCSSFQARVDFLSSMRGLPRAK